MQNRDSLSNLPLGAVVDAIASDDVAPGAGSAAAVGLALAAACAAKAVSVTLKNERDDVQLARVRESLLEVARRALRGADEDATHFREFMHEKDAPAAQDLLDTGKRLQQLGRELLILLDQIEPRILEVVRGDLTAARALCVAFAEIQSGNLAETRQAASRTDDHT